MTKETVLQIIDNNIIDNNDGAITADVLRRTLKSIVELTTSQGSQRYNARIGAFKSVDENTFSFDSMRQFSGFEDEKFDYEIKADGMYLVVAIPTDLLASSILSNGIEIPMQPPFVYQDNHVFVSSCPFKQGVIQNITITIN